MMNFFSILDPWKINSISAIIIEVSFIILFTAFWKWLSSSSGDYFLPLYKVSSAFSMIYRYTYQSIINNKINPTTKIYRFKHRLDGYHISRLAPCLSCTFMKYSVLNDKQPSFSYQNVHGTLPTHSVTQLLQDIQPCNSRHHFQITSKPGTTCSLHVTRPYSLEYWSGYLQSRFLPLHF